jgi:hypothetical protein
MRIAMRLWKIRDEVVLAACDPNLLGKKYEEGDLHIEIKKEFYLDKYVNENAFRNALKIATIINLVGENVVRIAISEGIVEKENVILIQGIPHAQAVRMRY